MRQRLGDLDQLLLGDAQVAHFFSGVDLEIKFFEQAGRALVERCEVDESQASRLTAQPNVFGHRQIRDRAQFLLHDGDAGIEGFPRMMKFAAFAIDKNVAAIGLNKAHQNAEKGGFTRAVAAAQGMNGSTPQAKLRILQRHDRAKGFPDAADLQQIGGRWRMGISRHSCTSG